LSGLWDVVAILQLPLPRTFCCQLVVPTTHTN
jgi:hypothetical protein